MDGDIAVPLTSMPRSVVDAFAIVRATTPDSTALRFEGETWTFARLDDEADRLARLIAPRVAAPGSIVALALQRSPEMVIAMLAAMKAGAAYLPIDPDMPAARNGFMLNDSGARLLIAHDGFDLPEGVTLPRLAPNAGSEGAAAAPIERRPGGDDLAYVLYTSGSTGHPKPVAIEHANVVAFAMQPSYVPITAATRMLHLARPAFDVTVFEVWAALLNGASVIIAPAGPIDPVALDRLLCDEKVDVAWLTAGLMRHLASLRPTMFRGLRYLLAGGDVVPPSAARAILDANPGIRMINGYGPTETTVFAACHVIERADLAGERLPIGRPIRGVAIHILDEALRPVLPGEVGEIHIAGSLVGRGYLGRPELTAERFISCPFGPSGSRMYKSGDLGRWLPDGSVDFVGRGDHQIKVRGFRVEPAEIEAALLAAPCIAEAIVVARDINGEKQLVAYVVARPRGADPDFVALRARLAETLPDFMIPTAIVALPELPLTANGKVDRDALPLPSRAVGGGTAPRDDAESLLCRLFAELTGAASVGRDDDFFALGGTSLTSMHFAVRYAEATGRPLALAALFRHPTPAALAAVLRAGRRRAWSPLLPLRRAGDGTPLFCVHPATGSAAGFMTLADALPPRHPVWGLQARGFDPGEPAHDNIADMAASYVDAVRSVQPRGPYALLGWSLGGIIAHEMARLLEGDGETVALLAILDSPVPGAGALDIGGEQDFARDALRRLVQSDGAGRARRARLLHAAAVGRGFLPADAPVEWAERMLMQVARSYDIVRSHEAGVIRGGILFVRAAPEGDFDRPEAFGWHAHTTARVRALALPTRHNAMLRPDMVAHIAREVMAELA